VRLESFVLHHLPAPGSRVLEVGCGEGRLARALAAAGHRVVAIDPEAPEGPIFRRVALDQFADEGPFDAVVASRSLHHIHDLARGLDRIVELLRPSGTLVVNDYAYDRVDERTLRWHVSNHPHPGAPRDANALVDWWRKDHVDIHGYGSMRPELDRRFVERYFAWGPHFYEELDAVEPAEELRLIEAGEVEAVGFRFVGERRGSPGDR
jgi:SAM-dependent methyltransferase